MIRARRGDRPDLRIGVPQVQSVTRGRLRRQDGPRPAGPAAPYRTIDRRRRSATEREEMSSFSSRLTSANMLLARSS